MSEFIEQQVQEIKNKIATAQKKQVRAEHVYDSAKAAVEKIKDRLKDEFGVETVEEAQAMLSNLEVELNKSLESAREALSKVS
jgi:NADP-dependent 3-hydroxy acid dehydrogenase YdfG